jgi:hypothetical protein
MVYLKMMSAPQTTHYQMVDCYKNNELERMWKEATVASLEVLFQRWPGGTKESHMKPVIIMAQPRLKWDTS